MRTRLNRMSQRVGHELTATCPTILDVAIWALGSLACTNSQTAVLTLGSSLHCESLVLRQLSPQPAWCRSISYAHSHKFYDGFSLRQLAPQLARCRRTSCSQSFDWYLDITPYRALAQVSLCFTTIHTATYRSRICLHLAKQIVLFFTAL